MLSNQRTFYSQGAQTKFNGQFNWGATSHDVELGLRLHQDQIRRTHMQDLYAMTSGHMVFTGLPAVANDLNANKATALTFNFLENLKWRSWVLTLLGRTEQVKFQYNDILNHRSLERNDSVFAPGAGLLYNFSNQFSVKGSINRGVGLAGLDDLGSEAKEKSINYELGFKYNSQDLAQQAELIAFYNDYSNITGTCSDSSGCNGSQLDLQFNGGRAVVEGIETRLTQNFYMGAVHIPLQLNLTALKAEFRNSFNSHAPEWGIGQVNTGDPLPYIPQIQYSFSAGAEYRKFKNEFSFIYQGDSYDQSATQGRLKVPAYGIIDWTGQYTLNKKTQFFARADNLLGKDYLVSYRPYGARPGKPQSFMVGLSYVF
jgi:Fe(3+) dicitrate transport protein